MSLKTVLNYPLEKRIAIIFDFDLTMTEDWQQRHYLAKNLKAIKKAYDGRQVINRKTGEKEILSIKKPGDYFKISDVWSEAHNGIGYVQQMIHDARKGILKDFTEENLMLSGEKVKISPGLPAFFKKLKRKWSGKCDISFFIVSVGLQSIIEGSSIVKSGEIDEVHATKLIDLESFWGSKKKKALDCMTDIVIPFNKTSHAIRVAKGGKIKLNKVMDHSEYMFDYRNIITIGDGTSDISQFAYLRKKGARVVGVYEHDSMEAFNTLRTNRDLQDRCNAIKPRNYNVGTALWIYTNQVIASMLNQHGDCNFDPEYIDMYRKNKSRDPIVRRRVTRHLADCAYCNSLLTLDISGPEKIKSRKHN